MRYRIGIILICAGLNSCGLVKRMSGDSVRNQSHPGASSQSRLESEGKETFVENYQAGDSTVSVYVSSGVIPAGTLAINQDGNFNGNSVATDLGVSEPVELISSSISLSASTSLTETQISQVLLSFETNEKSALHLVATSQLIVIYQIKRTDGTYELGILPQTSLKVVGRKIQFYAIGLGTYQLARTEAPLPSALSKKKNVASESSASSAESQVSTTSQPAINTIPNFSVRRNSRIFVQAQITNLPANAQLPVTSANPSVVTGADLSATITAAGLTIDGRPVPNATGTATIKIAANVNGSTVTQSFDVTVENRNWSAAGERLSPTTANSGTNGSGDAGVISAATGDGKATSIWAGSSNGLKIYRAGFNGSSWSKPANSSDFVAPSGSSYAMYGGSAVAGNGDIVLAWLGDGKVFIAERRNGIWTFPIDTNAHISKGGTSVSGPVAISGNRKGEVVVVWRQQDASLIHRTFKSEYRNGVWTHPTSLTDYISIGGESTGSGLSVAMNDVGTTLITWNQLDGTYHYIFKSEYHNNTWTHPVILTDKISLGSSNAGSAAAAIDNNNNAIIAWHQNDGLNEQIYISEYRSGTWTHPTSNTDRFSAAGRPATYPSVAISDRGHIAVAYYQTNSAGFNQAMVREYQNGAWATAPLPDSDALSASTANVTRSSSPAIKADRVGNLAIVYGDYQSTLEKKMFRQKDFGSTWQNPVELTGNGYALDMSTLSVHPDGDIAINWIHNNTGTYEVFGQVYH